MRRLRANPSDQAVRDLISGLLPTSEQTLLLQACLLNGEPGTNAWTRYLCAAEASRTGPAHWTDLKVFSPLLWYRLRRNGVSVKKGLGSYLRTAYLRERLRSETCYRILGTVLDALECRGISTLILKDGALTRTSYPEPGMRHCGSLDLLVDEAEQAQAVKVLLASSCAPFEAPTGSLPPWMTLRHPSGLLFRLGHRLPHVPTDTMPFSELWARSRPASFAGIAARVPSPEDLFLQVVLSGFSAESHAIPYWVPDTWYLLARGPDLDWSVLINRAIRAQRAPLISVALEYLSERFQAPIPAPALVDLRNERYMDPSCAATMFGELLGGPPVPWQLLWSHAPTLRARRLVLTWVLSSPPGPDRPSQLGRKLVRGALAYLRRAGSSFVRACRTEPAQMERQKAFRKYVLGLE